MKRFLIFLSGVFLLLVGCLGTFASLIFGGMPIIFIMIVIIAIFMVIHSLTRATPP